MCVLHRLIPRAVLLTPKVDPNPTFPSFLPNPTPNPTPTPTPNPNPNPNAGGFTEGQLEEMGYKGGEGDEDFKYASIPNLFMRRMQRTVSRVSTQVGWRRTRLGCLGWG